MFTSIDKAIVAAIMALVMILQNAGVVVPDFMTAGWAEGIVALLTPVIVYFWPNKDPLEEKRVQSPPLVGLLAMLLALTMLAGCVGTGAAYKAADGIDETAKVVGEHYYATVRELNELDDAGALTPSALAHAQDLVRTSQPLVQDLASAAQAYEQVRSAENEAELEAAINEAAKAISKLVDAVKDAGGGGAQLERIERDLDRLLSQPLLAAA